MKLYIVRHGHSPSAREAGVISDFDRPLSEEGKAAALKAGLLIKDAGKIPEMILHSPLKRAHETALQINSALNCPQGTKSFQPLSNILTAPELFNEIKPWALRCEGLVLVGHQPQLGDMVYFLCGKNIGLQPAQIVTLELNPQQDFQASFLWSSDSLSRRC
jgi:phosphohistidine phosphatase